VNFWLAGTCGGHLDPIALIGGLICCEGRMCYHRHRGDAYFVEGIVTLIVYYVVFMIVGDFAAYFLGLFTEYEWGSQVSLIVFLALYFLFLWVSWVLAVRVTKPKTAEQQSS
jgi:uncharacterized membrane protein